MGIIDANAKRNKKILDEQERINKAIPLQISQLIKSLDDAAHFGIYVQEDILLNKGTGIFTIDDAIQMKAEFAQNAPLITLLASKVAAMAGVEDADPDVFAQNIADHKLNYPLDMDGYITRFNVPK